MALVGMAQVSSRYWLSTEGAIPKDAAEELLARLAWRGISGWPLADAARQPVTPALHSRRYSVPGRRGAAKAGPPG